MDEMTAEQAVEAVKGLTFEQIWAFLIQSQKEMQKSVDESLTRSEKSISDMTKTVSDVTKNLGGLGNTLGRFTESMFSNELWQKFNEFGYTFSKQSEHVKLEKDGKVLTEIDFFLEDGKYAMLVEIKTDLTLSDVNEHIERIEKVREYMDARNDSRKLVGAVAGGIVPDSVLKYAQRKGLYVVQQTSDSIAIAPMPEGFTPHEW